MFLLVYMPEDSMTLAKDGETLMRILGSFIFCATLLTPVYVKAGAWTLKRGELWVKSSILYQKTDERYYSRNQPCVLAACEEGQRVPFPFDGESRFTAGLLELSFGVTDVLELQTQIPYYDISFRDASNPDRPGTASFGDIWFGGKYRLLQRPVVFTVRSLAKAPTGLFNKDSEFVPVGDGQWDWLIMAQIGHSFWPWPLYANVDVGYRKRFAPALETSDFKPGDEWLLRAEAGVNVTETILLKAALEGLWGKDFENVTTDLIIGDSGRRIVYFEPGVYWEILDKFAAEAVVKFSVAGRNYPAGEVWSAGFSYLFDL